MVKSKIAKGLDIDRSAKKMLQKALGKFISDGEYRALQEGNFSLVNRQKSTLKEDKNIEKLSIMETLYSGAIEEFSLTSNDHSNLKLAGIDSAVETIKTQGMARAISLLGRERVKSVLRELYETPMSIDMVASFLGVGHGTVVRYFRLLSIPTRPVRKPRVEVKLTPVKELERKELTLNLELKEVRYIYPDPAFCYLIGFIVGDGTISDIDVAIWNTAFELLPQIREVASQIANRLGVGTSEYYYDKKGRRVLEADKAYVWRLVIHSVGLARLISSEEERLKRDFLNEMLNPNRIGYFLAGLWDADGSVLPPYHIYLTQNETNKTLLELIKQTLQNLEIPSSIYLTRRAQTTIYPVSDKFIKTRENAYRLLILAKGIPKWIKIVGHNMRHPKKRETISEIEKRMLA